MFDSYDSVFILFHVPDQGMDSLSAIAEPRLHNQDIPQN